jgi:hypothetical protein
LLYELPQTPELPISVPKLRSVMPKPSGGIESRLDLFPPMLVHHTPHAVSVIDLAAVNTAKGFGMFWTPRSPVGVGLNEAIISTEFTQCRTR